MCSSDRNFKVLKRRLDRQEKFFPLTHLEDFYATLFVLKEAASFIRAVPKKRPHLTVLSVPTIDVLAKVLTYARDITSPEEGVCFVCDVHGVMTNETVPLPGERRTPHNGIVPLFDEIKSSRRIEFCAASAFADGGTVLQDLRDTGLADHFFVRSENDYFEPVYKQFVHDAYRKHPLHVRVHGLVAAAKYENGSEDPHYRQKGFAPSIAFYGQTFPTVVIGDDSPANLTLAAESLLQSTQLNSLEQIYLVLVHPVSDPEADKLSSETVKNLRAALEKSTAK